MNQVIALNLVDVLNPEWIDSAMGRLDERGDAVVIRGSSTSFCLGLPLGDIAFSQSFDALGAVRSFALLLQRLRGGGRPVVAVVEGAAKGAGVGLAAVADFVVARPEATFQLPEVLLGLIPAAVFPFVAQRTGWSIATRMALGEGAISAQRAEQYGLVDVITSTPELEIESRLRQWRCAEPCALAAVKQLAAEGWDFEEAVQVFASLWSGDAPSRIDRFSRGHAPWDETS